MVRDEAYLTASEALRNAVKHAGARRVTVTIHSQLGQLRLTVRDDGKGIDAETMARPAEGHFGPPGMRERAAIVKGDRDVERARRRTEIELRVPGENGVPPDEAVVSVANTRFEAAGAPSRRRPAAFAWPTPLIQVRNASSRGLRDALPRFGIRGASLRMRRQERTHHVHRRRNARE